MMANEAKIDALRIALSLMTQRPDLAETYIQSVIDSYLTTPDKDVMEVINRIRLGGYALNANDPKDRGPNGVS